LIWSPESYLVRNKLWNSFYAVCSSSLLPCPSWTQIPSSAPYPQTSSALIENLIIHTL
jgi:hypothetical protein